MGDNAHETVNAVHNFLTNLGRLTDNSMSADSFFVEFYKKNKIIGSICLRDRPLMRSIDPNFVKNTEGSHLFNKMAKVLKKQLKLKNHECTL